MLKRTLNLLALCLVALLVIGCSDTDTIDNPPVPQTLPTPFPGFTFPILDLANSQIPLPNDLLRDPVTGLLTIPGEGEPFTAARTLDGWSTSGAIIIPFRGRVVAETVTNDTLPVFNTANGQQALMTYSVTEATQGSVVTATPVIALQPATQYIVVTSSGIISENSATPILSDNAINILKGTSPLVDGNGNSTNPALDDATAGALEPVRAGYQPIWQGAETLTGQPRSNIPLAFAFTTQTLFEALPAARTVVKTANAGLTNANPAFLADPVTFAAAEFAPVGMGHETTDAAIGNEAPGNGGNLDFAAGGSLPTVERFMAENISPLIPTADIGRIHLFQFTVPTFRDEPVEGFWSNPLAQVGTKTINGVLFLPNSAQFPEVLKGVGGLPVNMSPADVNQPKAVVIFQHGITGNKFQAAALANAVCGQDLALVAIDLELHGDNSEPVASNDSAVSGQGFINVPNLRNSRDNARQSVVNLYALVNAITSGQTNIDAPLAAGLPGVVPELGAPAVNAAFPNPGYISLSLGSIVGDVLHATEPDVSVSVLNVGGARLSNLLLTSETFAQPILDGLAQQGVVAGTSDFASFVLILQAIVDDADPVNYAAQATSGALRGGTPAVILQQANVTDAVVPPAAQIDLAIQHAAGNAAFSQADAINAQALIAQVNTPFQGSGLYEIPNATHGALLDPSNGNPTVAIVTQALTYIGGGFAGTATIVDTGIRARSINEAAAETAEDLANYANIIKF